MNKFVKFASAGLALAIAAGAAMVPAASAQNRTTMLVLAETHDPDSLRRDNRVSVRVRDSIQEQLNQAGFDVYDEGAVTYETTDQTERRLSDAELIDIARNNTTYPGTDRKLLMRVAATYQVYVTVTELGYSNKARVRVSGRLIDVQSGRFLGNYELVDPGGQLRLHPTRCADRDCVLEEVGDHAKPIGQAVGNELARLLAADKGGQSMADGTVSASGPETYTLRFENMTDKQMMDMEVYIVEVFSGYRSHQPAQAMGMTHVYDYVSEASAAKMKRNLVRALDELGWDGKVYVNGNVFTVKKTAIRSSAVERENVREW